MSRVKRQTLEFHENQEGVTIPVYRDNDLKGNVDAARMIYVTTVGPGMSKGPIIHKKRNSIVIASGGLGLMTIRDPEGHFEHVDLASVSAVSRFSVEIPPLYAVSYSNRSEHETTIFTVIADYAWKPGDDESVKYDNWHDFEKRTGNRIEQGLL